MTALLIVNLTMKDAEKFKAYAAKAPKTLETAGAKVLFKGPAVKVLAGENQHKVAVVIEFPSQEAIEKWYYSDEYQSIIPMRDAGADVVFTSYGE